MLNDNDQREANYVTKHTLITFKIEVCSNSTQARLIYAVRVVTYLYCSFQYLTTATQTVTANMAGRVKNQNPVAGADAQMAILERIARVS